MDLPNRYQEKPADHYVTVFYDASQEEAGAINAFSDQHHREQAGEHFMGSRISSGEDSETVDIRNRFTEMTSAQVMRVTSEIAKRVISEFGIKAEGPHYLLHPSQYRDN